MKGNHVRYAVETRCEYMAYPYATHRVVVELGVLLIYERRPCVLFENDSAALLEAHGHGEWKRLSVQYD